MCTITRGEIYHLEYPMTPLFHQPQRQKISLDRDRKAPGPNLASATAMNEVEDDTCKFTLSSLMIFYSEIFFADRPASFCRMTFICVDGRSGNIGAWAGVYAEVEVVANSRAVAFRHGSG